MFTLTIHLLVIFFVTGLIAGTIDAIAGGGGLISLPMLLSVGMPPHIALGTNKLQSSVGTLMATWRYHREGWITLKSAYQGLIFGMLGAIAGSIVGQMLAGNFLNKIIPILLLVILIYTFFAPRQWSTDYQPKMQESWFYSIFGLLLGFYDAFLGPGTGSFWVFVLVYFLGFTITKATAYTKIFNLNSNIVALICFAIGHHVDYRIGLCMAGGQLLGGQIGAHLAIRRGATFIRPIFMMVVSMTIITLLLKTHQITTEIKLLSAGAFSILLVLYWYYSLKMKFKN